MLVTPCTGCYYFPTRDLCLPPEGGEKNVAQRGDKLDPRFPGKRFPWTGRRWSDEADRQADPLLLIIPIGEGAASDRLRLRRLIVSSN